MNIKVFDSELKVMEVLWKEGEVTASYITKILKDEIGWNINTTYTIIKKLIVKGAIKRREPKFKCIPLITKEQVQKYEARELGNKLFAGDSDRLTLSSPQLLLQGTTAIFAKFLVRTYDSFTT